MQNNVVKNYRIGDLYIRYIGPEFSEMEYLKIFRGENLENCEPDIVYEMVGRDIIEVPMEKCLHQDRYIDVYENANKRIRVVYDEKKERAIVKDVLCENGYHKIEYDETYMTFWNTNMMMKIFDIPNQVIRHSGIFLHASCVEYNGYGLVFTADKQIGKSTQAALWEKHRKADVINGDRVLLRKNDDMWMAYGSPYAGTSRVFKNASVPINAIIVLSQGMENKIFKMNSLESLRALMEGCSYQYWDRNCVVQVMDIVQELLKDVMFIKLECTPDIAAVEAVEGFLWNLKTEK